MNKSENNSNPLQYAVLSVLLPNDENTWGICLQQGFLDLLPFFISLRKKGCSKTLLIFESNNLGVFDNLWLIQVVSKLPSLRELLYYNVKIKEAREKWTKVKIHKRTHTYIKLLIHQLSRILLYSWTALGQRSLLVSHLDLILKVFSNLNDSMLGKFSDLICCYSAIYNIFISITTCYWWVPSSHTINLLISSPPALYKIKLPMPKNH